MQNLLLTIGFIMTQLLLLIPIRKIILLDKIDNDFLFIYLSNLLLLFAFFYTFLFKNDLFLSFFMSLFLMIFSYLLTYHIKNLFGKYNLFSLPYFFLCVYTFSNILILSLF